ncbi:MAG: hypothetical protein IPG45_04515 [Deltaproteobacteria bacterium]|nr:hypothetical protein [Deltaproteobacteria bacterium]
MPLAVAHLEGTRAAVDQTLRALEDPQALATLEEAVTADHALAAQLQELQSLQASLQFTRVPGEPIPRAEVDRSLELRSLVVAIKDARRALRAATPALGLIDAGDDGSGRRPLREVAQAGAERLHQHLDQAKRGLLRGDIDPWDSERLLDAAAAAAPLEDRDAINATRAARAAHQTRAAVGEAVLFTVLGGAALIATAGAALAISAVGAGLGGISAACGLERADDQRALAQASLTADDALIDPDAAATEYAFALVNAAFAVADLALLSKGLRAARAVPSPAPSIAGAQHLDPQFLSRILTERGTPSTLQLLQAFGDHPGHLQALADRLGTQALAELTTAVGPTTLRRQLRHLGPDGLTHLLDTLLPTGTTELLAGRPKPAALDALRKGLRTPATRDTLKALVPEPTLVRLLSRGADPELLATTVTRFEALKVNTSPTADLLVYLENLEPHRLNDELHHAALAAHLEALDESHVIRRHGPQIPDAALEQRLKDGSLRYEGTRKAPKAATRFSSFLGLQESREAGAGAFGRERNLDLTGPPGPEHIVALEEARATARAQGLSHFELGVGGLVSSPHSERLGFGLSIVNGAPTPLPDLSRTQTKLVWRVPVDSPLLGRWVVVQHHPVEFETPRSVVIRFPPRNRFP